MRLLTFVAMAGNGMTVGMGGGRDLSGHLHPSSLLVLLSPELDADAVVSGFTCNASPRIGNDDEMRPRLCKPRCRGTGFLIPG